MGYTNSSIVPAAIRGDDRETQNGNMSTVNRRGRRYIGGTGQMPQAWARLLSDRAEVGAVTQIIYSYSTPIAWRDSEYGWIIPRVTYSVTTSAKHQCHLYQLPGGRNLAMPWDATPEDAQRVLDGRMLFVTDSRSRYAIGTIPGPNYVEGE